MAQINLSLQFDTNDPKDLEALEKLENVLESVLPQFETTASPAKTAPKSRAKAAPKEEAEEDETPAKAAPKSRSRAKPAAAKANDELEELTEEGRVILAKVIEKFRDDIKEEFKFYGVKTISDFKKLEDLEEFVDFLKELEEELEEEEEKAPEKPKRRR